MSRPKKDTSDLIRGGNKFVSIMSKICTAVDKAGGCSDDVAALDADTPGAKKRLGQIAKILRGSAECFEPLADADVPKRHQATLAIYRKEARKHHEPVPVTTPLCYRVKAGFTLKIHAPKAGPCYKNFRYLQDWDFPDDATQDSIVFWIPRVLTGSISEEIEDRQIQFLAGLRARLGLPAHHMSGFGKVSLVAGLALAHFKATGESDSLLDGYWVRTDTHEAVGGRIHLSEFCDEYLRCDYFIDPERACPVFGVFAIGVEKL